MSVLNRIKGLDPSNRAEWHAWRKGGVGASEVAAILGCSPWSTPLDVYAAKIGEKSEDGDNLAMEIGRDLEPTVKRLYQRETGRFVSLEQIPIASAARPFLRATLDGVCEDGRIVEYKTTSVSRNVGDEGTDELPDHIICQAQAQAIVADTDVVDVAVLSLGRGHKFSVHPVRRNEELCKLIIDRTAEFWQRVIDRNPPPFSAPSDVRHLPLILDEGETIELSEALADDWDTYQTFGQEATTLGKKRDEIKARIHAAMGTASVGLLPDGGRIVRKIVNRKGYECPASTYTTLTYKAEGK